MDKIEKRFLYTVSLLLAFAVILSVSMPVFAESIKSESISVALGMVSFDKNGFKSGDDITIYGLDGYAEIFAGVSPSNADPVMFKWSVDTSILNMTPMTYSDCREDSACIIKPIAYGDAWIKVEDTESGASLSFTVHVVGKSEENTIDTTDKSNTSDKTTDKTPNASDTQKSTKVGNISLKTVPGKSIAAGCKVKIEAEILPTASANSAMIKWTTSNKKYATVDSKGVITTKKAGAGKTITIKAIAQDGSNKSATVKIKIKKGIVKSIKLTGKKSVKAGKKIKIKTKIKATAGANKKISFKSSNSQYATVNKNGVVKTKKAGKGKTVTITASATDGSNKKAKIRIKIK